MLDLADTGRVDLQACDPLCLPGAAGASLPVAPTPQGHAGEGAEREVRERDEPMSRRKHSYTPASRVITRDAETDKVIAVDPAYEPSQHKKIVLNGHDNSDPTLRARKRRGHNRNSV